MKVERDIALAFFDVVLGTPKVKEHLKGRLGYGHVPTVDDLKSRASDVIEKSETFLEYVAACVQLFQKELKSRERQGELDFSAPGGTGEKTSTKEEKRARAKVAKGDPKGRQKAIDAVTGKSKAKTKKKAAAKKSKPKEFGDGLTKGEGKK